MTGAKQAQALKGSIVMMAVILLLLAGCSTLKKGDKATTTTTAPAARKDTPVYYDFDDVLIPKELKVERDDSFVYQTAGFTVGVLTLKARVDIGSLIGFFEKNMPKDNWRMISEFKSPRTMMLFQKENRWAVIEINEGTYYTSVKIWVAPTMSTAGSGLLK
jgi:hypothetical protein